MLANNPYIRSMAIDLVDAEHTDFTDEDFRKSAAAFAEDLGVSASPDEIGQALEIACEEIKAIDRGELSWSIADDIRIATTAWAVAEADQSLYEIAGDLYDGTEGHLHVYEAFLGCGHDLDPLATTSLTKEYADRIVA